MDGNGREWAQTRGGSAVKVYPKAKTYDQICSIYLSIFLSIHLSIYLSIYLLAPWVMLLSFDQGGCCFPPFVTYSGCAWPVPPLLSIEANPADSVSASLAEAGHARFEEPGKNVNKGPQLLGHAKHTPGSRFRAEARVLRLAKAWPRACPTAVQASCALNLA